MTAAHVPLDVQTTLNYYQPQDQAPTFYFSLQSPAGVLGHNITSESHLVVIHDARDKEHTFSLDISGLQWVNHSSAEKEFLDEEKIKTVYYAEVEDILKEYAGAKRIFTFDYAIRRNPDTQTKPDKTRTVRCPTHLLHSDHTLSGAERLVKLCLPEDADRLLKGRYQIINLWRPVSNNVAHEPLGVVDFRSIDVNSDLVMTRAIFPNCEYEIYSVKYNPGHKLYYLSDQTPDEVTLIKCFDSDTNKARLAPFSSFYDPTRPADAPPRESIEVRALVFDSE